MFFKKNTRFVFASNILFYVFVYDRDLEDIGCYVKVIEGCQQLDKETKSVI